MISIDNMMYGWADLQIGDCIFNVSYLSDLKHELDALFDFSGDEESRVNKIILEGEDFGDLSLVAHLTFEDVNVYLPSKQQRDDASKYDYVINIFWQTLYSCKSGNVSVLKFSYKEFMNEYNALVKDIKKVYVDCFLLPFNNEERQKLIENY